MKVLCIDGQKGGVLARNEAREAIANYRSRTAELAERASKGRVRAPLGVGHQVASHQAYPVFPGEIEDWEFDAVERMRTSFEALQLGAVEVDIQLGPKGKRVYLIHEEFPAGFGDDGSWESVEWFYEKNDLRRLVDSFIRNGYYRDRFLFIEFKATRADSMDGNEERTVERALEVIDEVIKASGADVEAEEVIRRHIGFLSFNYLMLGKVVEIGREEEGVWGHPLYYVGCSNGFWRTAIARCLCPELNDLRDLVVPAEGDAEYKVIWEWANRNNELSGIWVSPFYVEDVATVLGELNARRVARGLRPFQYFLSTYQKGREEFFSVLEEGASGREAEHFYGNIRGLMFDVNE